MRSCEKRKKLPVAEERRRREARDNLYTFVQEFWEEIESFKFIPGWHIEAICFVLMAVTFETIKNAILRVPPRTSKSRVFTMFWPAWEFARGMPSRFLFTGNDQELVTEMSVECRRIIESEKFQRWFPTAIHTDQNTKKKFDLANGGQRQITSVNSNTTGKGGNRLCADDVHDADDSPARFAEKVKWCRETWITRGDPGGYALVYLGQTLDYNDILMTLLREMPDLFSELCLPLHYDPERHCRVYLGDWYAKMRPGSDGWWEDPRTEPGEVLWPAVFTPEKIQLLRRTMGERKFRAQFEQNPLPDGGQEFKPAWLEPRWKRLHVKNVLRFLFSLDASFKGEETSDWCVLGLIAQCSDKVYRHCGQVRAKLDYPKLKAEVLRYHELWRSRGIMVATTIVEDKANGTALIAEMKRSLPGVVPYSPKDSKIVRYRAISGILEALQFELPEEGAVLVLEDGTEIEIDASFVLELVAELLAIPGGPNDDQADMIAQVILYCEDPANQPKGTPRVGLAKRSANEASASNSAGIKRRSALAR